MVNHWLVAASWMWDVRCKILCESSHFLDVRCEMWDYVWVFSLLGCEMWDVRLSGSLLTSGTDVPRAKEARTPLCNLTSHISHRLTGTENTSLQFHISHLTPPDRNREHLFAIAQLTSHIGRSTPQISGIWGTNRNTAFLKNTKNRARKGWVLFFWGGDLLLVWPLAQTTWGLGGNWEDQAMFRFAIGNDSTTVRWPGIGRSAPWSHA